LKEIGERYGEQEIEVSGCPVELSLDELVSGGYCAWRLLLCGCCRPGNTIGVHRMRRMEFAL